MSEDSHLLVLQKFTHDEERAPGSNQQTFNLFYLVSSLTATEPEPMEEETSSVAYGQSKNSQKTTN